MCGSGMWDWQDEDCCLARDSRLGVSFVFVVPKLSSVENLLLVLMTSSGIHNHRLDGSKSYIDKRETVAGEAKGGLEEHKEASRVKRRRVLRFPSVADGATADNGQPSSAPVRSKVFN
ncbi:hypothetical protein BHM03_00051265 [Ensete ventricosum]|nr:hypothetical protein BHM03_00051265 [Ensete ventricosum]